MNQTTVFKIGSNDYSGHVLAGTYDVQKKEEYEEYEDGNKRTHHRTLRYRVVGSFDMFFRTKAEYDAFDAAVTNATALDGTVYATVTTNKPDTEISCDLFIEFAPVRNIDGNWDDYMESFTVNIREA